MIHRSQRDRPEALKSYYLKFSGRQQGPYSESQIAQMFADQRVNRDTPCKLDTANEWRTIDEYLPTLKYGTQLPPATPKPVNIATPARGHGGIPPETQRIAIADLDIPFGSLLKMMFKVMGAWFIVFCCFIPAMILVWVIVTAIFATFLGGVMSSLHHP